MAKVRFTNKAVEDLSEIWNYTFDKWSESQADIYYTSLVSACRKVAANPFLFGQTYRNIQEDLFGYRCHKHIIFYRVLENRDVEIIRILHQRMDLETGYTHPIVPMKTIHFYNKLHICRYPILSTNFSLS